MAMISSKNCTQLNLILILLVFKFNYFLNTTEVLFSSINIIALDYFYRQLFTLGLNLFISS